VLALIYSSTALWKALNYTFICPTFLFAFENGQWTFTKLMISVELVREVMQRVTMT